MNNYNRIKKVITSNVKIEEERLTPDASFFGNLRISPFHFIKIIIGLMDEFDTEITDKEAENFKTVGDVLLYFELKNNSLV